MSKEVAQTYIRLLRAKTYLMRLNSQETAGIIYRLDAGRTQDDASFRIKNLDTPPQIVLLKDIVVSDPLEVLPVRNTEYVIVIEVCTEIPVMS
jgi:hypothetical protein